MAEAVRVAKARAEELQAKLLQIYSVANVIGKFDSLEREDPPQFSSHDVIRIMVLVSDQLNEVADDVAGLIGGLRDASAKNQDTLAAVK
jgi:hypothetical protein